MAAQIGGDSKDAVALALYEEIKSAEYDEGENFNREWILKTYALCRDVVESPQRVADHLGREWYRLKA